MKQRHAWIGDVRGRGLMQALEIVDPVTEEPDPARARRLLETTRRELLTLAVTFRVNRPRKAGLDGVERFLETV